MRSRRGFSAAIVFLCMLPLAVLAQAVFGVDAEVVVHLVGALGFGLLALAVFDFRTPRWMNVAGGLAAAALGLTFLLQGVAPLAGSESLTYLAFQVLGQQVESLLVDVLVIWFLALLVTDSEGATRVLGVVAVVAMVAYEIYRYVLMYVLSGLDMEPVNLRIVFLLPFVWLLLESAKRGSPGAARAGARVA